METRPVEGNFSEDMVVHEYMREYGIDMVRGGTYSRLQLPEHQLRTISDVITHGSRRCFSCGTEGHFAEQCPNNNRRIGMCLYVRFIFYIVYGFWDR